MSRLPRTVVIGLPTSKSIDEVQHEVSRVLSTKLSEHESRYFGGRYFRAGSPGGEEVYVFNNFDLIDAAPFYEDAIDLPILLRIDSGGRDPEQLLAVLTEVFGAGSRVLETGV